MCEFDSGCGIIGNGVGCRFGGLHQTRYGPISRTVCFVHLWVFINGTLLDGCELHQL